MGRLENKVAIVTGAGAGIGEAIAHKFALEGAKLLLVGLPGDPVDDVAREVNKRGGAAVAYQGDVSDDMAARGAVQACVDKYGHVDILINNAGVFLAVGEIDQYPVDKAEQTIKMNTLSAFFMTKYAVPYLQKSQGNIVYAGSEAGELGEPYNTVYGATKGFVHAFMRGVASEQAAHGVRANCVCPGPIDTEMTHAGEGAMDKQMESLAISSTLMGRRGTPEEMANVYAFLASDEASYVTGALFFADGGISIAHGPAGLQADKRFKKEPKGELNLKHSQDGTINKDPVNVR